jgi:hypothetical protein
MPVNFFALPPELRVEIFALIFSSQFEPLHHPWDDGSSCGMIISLFLTSRQVYLEASSLLWQHHVQDLTLHFENSLAFIQFMQFDIPRWSELSNAKFRLRVTLHDRRQLPSIGEQMHLLAALLFPIPDYWSDDMRHIWEPLCTTGLDVWRSLHNDRKRPIRQRADITAGRKRVSHWVYGTYFLRLGHFDRKCYAWDTWLVLPRTDPNVEDARVPGGRHIGTRDGTQDDCMSDSSAAGWDVAMGRKVRSECVVIEGRIADAVQAWYFYRLRK